MLQALAVDAGAPQDAFGIATLLADEADQAGRRRGQNAYRVARRGTRWLARACMDNVHEASSSVVYRLLLGK